MRVVFIVMREKERQQYPKGAFLKHSPGWLKNRQTVYKPGDHGKEPFRESSAGIRKRLQGSEKEN